MGSRWSKWPLIAWLAMASLPHAQAQSVFSGDEQNVANFAFATQLGSGVYSVSGRTLQIYRLPFRYELRSSSDSSFGIALTLPVTLGFYDFELQDVANGDIPTSVDAISFVPGLEFEFQVKPDWSLTPYVEAGVSKAQHVAANIAVYSAGLASLYEFGGGAADWQLRNDLTFAGVDLHGAGGSNHFTRFQTVVTARRPIGNRWGLDGLAYALNDYYVDQPEGPVDSADTDGDSFQYEVGFTLGTVEKRRIWGIPLPRVGIGYRFGSDLEAWRLVFGTPY